MRKGNLTTQTKAFETYKQNGSLADLHVSTLESILYSVWKAKVEYDHLQTLLVENHDLYSEELEIEVNQAASNLNLKTSIETLKDSIVLCRELQTFNQDCTKAKTRPISLPSGLDIRKQLCTTFKELKAKYRDLPCHDDIDVEMIQAQVAIDKMDAEVQEQEDTLVASSPPPISTSTSAISGTTFTTASIKHSNLKLNLPKFSGQLTEWKTFWSLFSSRMERETHLSESERITCLLEAMTTAEGKDVVQQAMGGSYDEVVTLLLERFDQPKIVYRHHLQSLLDLQTIEDDYN